MLFRSGFVELVFLAERHMADFLPVVLELAQLGDGAVLVAAFGYQGRELTDDFTLGAQVKSAKASRPARGAPVRSSRLILSTR